MSSRRRSLQPWLVSTMLVSCICSESAAKPPLVVVALARFQSSTWHIIEAILVSTRPWSAAADRASVHGRARPGHLRITRACRKDRPGLDCLAGSAGPSMRAGSASSSVPVGTLVECHHGAPRDEALQAISLGESFHYALSVLPDRGTGRGYARRLRFGLGEDFGKFVIMGVMRLSKPREIHETGNDK
jgi:hypothetical protein